MLRPRRNWTRGVAAQHASLSRWRSPVRIRSGPPSFAFSYAPSARPDGAFFLPLVPCARWIRRPLVVVFALLALAFLLPEIGVSPFGSGGHRYAERFDAGHARGFGQRWPVRQPWNAEPIPERRPGPQRDADHGHHRRADRPRRPVPDDPHRHDQEGSGRGPCRHEQTLRGARAGRGRRRRDPGLAGSRPTDRREAARRGDDRGATDQGPGQTSQIASRSCVRTR